jgi:hypothetical protein
MGVVEPENRGETMFGTDYASMVIYKQREEEIRKQAEQHRINTEKTEEHPRNNS